MNAVTSVPGVWLLDHATDHDHHRSVLTFAGAPEAVAEAAFRAIRVATDLIDLRKHQGVHPRIGATDVVPFVPMQGTTLQDCIVLAKQLGQRVGRELEIPVFFYEQAATRQDHASLESVRRGGLDGLAFRMQSDPDWAPDCGPSYLHPTAGAVVIGARPPLIAFNVNLRTTDLEVAKSIASAIRQSNGGVPHLKAIGVPLASRKLVQVAMNLTDHMVTSMQTAFEAVSAQAEQRGVEVVGSEVVGLVPQAAMVQAASQSLRIEWFDPSQVLETRLALVLSGKGVDKSEPPVSAGLDSSARSIATFAQSVAAATPAPGGGSVAAAVGALAASLGVMGARFSQQSVAEHRFLAISQRLLHLVQADGEAYRQFMRAMKLPAQEPTRSTAVSTGLHMATEIPLEIAELSTEAGILLHACRKQARQAVQSDITVGIVMAIAATKAGLHTVTENLKVQANQRLKVALRTRVQRVTRRLEELKGLCYTPLSSRSVGREKSGQASPEKVRRRHAWKLKSSITTSKKRSRLRRKSSRGKGSSAN
jgi:glutamate formiminotransferase/glutamate formiminotransferase/formiminotetrahydrofolate cyclodeaminase